MTENLVLHLPPFVLREVLSYLGSARSLPFALTSKASLAVVYEVFDYIISRFFRSSGLAVCSIRTHRSCFLQADELCEYGRGVMGMNMTNKEMINIAARLGLLNAVKWLRSQDPPCDWDAIASHKAAERGDIEMLKWGRSQTPPMPWNVYTCSSAAARGQLAVLQWLRSQDSRAARLFSPPFFVSG
jgi:hypothetical protein